MTELGFKPISSKLLPNEERNAELVMIASVGKVPGKCDGPGRRISIIIILTFFDTCEGVGSDF